MFAFYHTLRDAVMIPEINKKQLTMVTFTVNPARQFNSFTNIFGGEIGAMMRTIRMHVSCSLSFVSTNVVV
jgi:hypothetical protein